jgi:hypothetical protein
MLERERKIAIRLLITGSGVRVPHNPLRFINKIKIAEMFDLGHFVLGSYGQSEAGVYP